MRRHSAKLGRKREEGVIITLVAIFMLFVMGAMAALSIDVVTFYTARSEAQLAADSAALAGARVLANSGMTSDLTAATDNVMTNAQTIASTIATQVAQSNLVGGRTLLPGEIAVSFNGLGNNPCTTASLVNNPCVNVRVQRTDVPTYFARIWGSTQVTVAASATAEAYNPSGLANGTSTGPTFPVAPTCVKPWLLPNIDPLNSANPIFSTTNGAIQDSTLLGLQITGTRLETACDAGTLPTQCKSTFGMSAWKYYPGDPASFPPPDASSVLCPGCTTSFQLGVAGCVQTPIACNQQVNIDTSDATLWDIDNRVAVEALTHSSSNHGDYINTLVTPTPAPFQFFAGADDPLVQSSGLAADAEISVSDSLVTVPVFDQASFSNFPTVTLVGFVQLFLNPRGFAPPVSGHLRTSVINMVGCGSLTSGAAVVGNGGSAVPVRLVSH